MIRDCTPYSIRRAGTHHLVALGAIEQAAATIFPPDFLPEDILADRIPLDILISAREDDMLWVAVDAHDTPVGYLLVQVVDGLPLLAQLDVHPLHGRRGLGTALIAHAIGQVKRMGFSELYLTTFSNIPWNAPFYEKMGFKILNEPELPDPIIRILGEERMRGLNDRVAMRFSEQDR